MTITKRYPLEPHGRKRLELRRNTSTGEMAVVLDGRELARLPHEALHDGVDFALPDNSLLRVWVETGPRGVPFINVTRNGHPLPGAENDPVKTLWLTCSIFWCMATLQIFFGAVGLWYGRADATSNAIGAAGLALLVFGVFAWQRSYAATVLASLILFAELGLFFFFAARHDLASLWAALVAMSMLVFILLRGINAVAEINAHRLPIRNPPERIKAAPRPTKSNSA